MPVCHPRGPLERLAVKALAMISGNGSADRPEDRLTVDLGCWSIVTCLTHGTANFCTRLLRTIGSFVPSLHPTYEAKCVCVGVYV